MRPVDPDVAVLRLSAWSLLAAMALVPLLLAVAMACFPGGHSGVAEGYSFSRHVVSDLGRTRLSDGTPNPLSSVLFTAAMLVTGGATALFWRARRLFVRQPLARRAALVCGLVMSAGLAAVGLTPLNRMAALHDPVTAVTAVGGAAAILALFADADTRLESRRGKRFWLVFLGFVAGVWAVLVGLHHERLIVFRPWLPLWQKTLIASFIAWMAYQTFCLLRFCQTAGKETGYDAY